jgi:pyrroloquinoline-quinone synthase
MPPALPVERMAATPFSPAQLLEALKREGTQRYHARHPFHLRMHEGRLSQRELQSWAENRFYYQTRIPIKDALIVAKSEDSAFRRTWLRRIVDHDGGIEGEGGIELWLRLGDAVGLERRRLLSHSGVVPGVRFACDAYVNLVRQASLVEAVASSLTECFAPDLMSERIVAFERHYRFIDASALEYFRQRVPRARRDSEEALAFVLERAQTREVQDACVAALIKKTEILWHLLDCLQLAPADGELAP